MIAIFQFFCVFLVSFFKARKAFILFVFLIPFMPRYLGLTYGNDSSIDGRRIIMVFLSCIFAVWILNRNNLNRMLFLIKRSAGFFSVLLFLILVKFYSTFQESGFSNFLFVADDFLFSFVVTLLTMMFIRNNKQRESLFMGIIASLFFCEILAIVEFLRQAPLMQGVVDFSIKGTDDVKEGWVRNGVHRCSALFDNPLLLSNLVCITWPLSWCMRQVAFSKSLRTIALLSLVLAPSTLFFVASRAGWLISGLTAFALILIFSWRRMGGVLRLFFMALTSSFLILVFLWIYDIFQDPTAFFSGDDNSDVSALERINQYVLVAAAFSEHPFIGYGMQRDIAHDLSFLEHMDSYWLRLLIEGGGLGVSAFIGLVWIACKKIIKLQTQIHPHNEKKLLFVMLTLMITFFVSLFFIAIPTNNIYFFIMVGVIMGWDRRQRMGIKYL